MRESKETKFLLAREHFKLHPQFKHRVFTWPCHPHQPRETFVINTKDDTAQSMHPTGAHNADSKTGLH